jgi:hypothetical protein
MPLPFEIRNQIIQCFGTCFYYKDGMEAFLISAGVPRNTVSKYKDQFKFPWIKSILNELDQIENGLDIQRRIITELCKLRKLSDNNVQNPDTALSNLREIKRMAVEHDLYVEEEKAKTTIKKNIAEEKARIIEERSIILSKLHKTFMDGIINPNRQAAGYSLEDILEELFPLFSLEYRKSYKTETQQIDGHFRYESFDYLVEAKWRADQPNEQEIGGFKRKVDTKLESTRGVFFSINGFRDEVLEEFGGRSNILFFTGEDLIYILEGRISLDEVVKIKIEKAAQEGIVYFPAKEMN